MTSITPRLNIDRGTTTWLLDLPHPAPDFFHRGVDSLVPCAEQLMLDRVVAETEFRSGSERYGVIALLSRAGENGLHRLLDLAIRRRGQHWPVLCADGRFGISLTPG
jgi:hypothetical protein